MKCPRDGSDLAPMAALNGVGQQCPKCKGAFVHLDVEGEIGISRSTLKPDSRKKVPVHRDSRLVSPSSNQPMIAFRFRGVQIDYCEHSNSVWLDADEIVRATKTSKKLKRESTDSAVLSGIDGGVSANIDSLFEILGKAVGSLFH